MEVQQKKRKKRKEKKRNQTCALNALAEQRKTLLTDRTGTTAGGLGGLVWNELDVTHRGTNHVILRLVLELQSLLEELNPLPVNDVLPHLHCIPELRILFVGILKGLEAINGFGLRGHILLERVNLHEVLLQRNEDEDVGHVSRE